ncbi:TetR/AcrR family transcriptional regulator [Mycolicibacterium sp. P9-64]|uniref:TetR/AcrR family transcriptional regulator n=1 Tax=Mycolicibacterium sp. P9-64 TaxID=2024612 RepID=UPI0011F07F26|nr:TetR/AcrR family transcriptional regulator [Mycolicibacterium sp. P9-64]KAA0075729.1 TetR/AcrR family transcriptional regulator [Mycolicibacterium sp. P9-64]
MREPEPEQPASLRAAQVAQTRAALLAAGRRLFGENGFRTTSVEDLAREARVTTGALYHHFPTKTALFEAVFTQAHIDLLMTATTAAKSPSDDGPAQKREDLARGVDAFLDGILQPDIQRILVLDGPAVLGLARFTELDEQYAHAAIMHALVSVAEAGATQIADPDTTTSLLLGALTRGAMLIANSTDPVETRHAVARSMRSLLNSFTAPD